MKAMKFNALEPNTKQLVIWLVMIHNLFNTIAYPFSGALSNGLRTAGGVKFAMYGALELLLQWSTTGLSVQSFSSGDSSPGSGKHFRSYNLVPIRITKIN